LLREGKPVSLTPKAFETLLALVRSSGHVVKKDDLMQEVWPDVIVEEANLARNVWTVRKALGDDNGTPAYIETVPKFGYRFIAPVTALPGDDAGVEVQGRVRAPLVPEEPEGEETLEAPPLPPTERNLVLPVVLGIVVVISVTTIGLIRFWGNAKPSSEAVPGVTFLTDGRHDDTGAYWTNNGQIYFSRSITNSRVETWTMNGDGTNHRRANTDIKNLVTGRWSPDGKKVIFLNEGEPQTIFLADANGAREIALPFVPGNLDWSPDGSQFVYQARSLGGTSEILLYTLDTGTSVNLTLGVASADPSFSNDGKRIAFTSWRDGNSEIYVMHADGSNVRRLTNHPAFDNFPVFSPDGTKVAFQSNREDEHVEVYVQNLDDTTPPRRLTHARGTTGLMPKCWSADGTRMLVYTNENGKGQIELIDVDPFPAQRLLGDETADLGYPRMSTDGRRLLYEARLPDHAIELRVTDLHTKRTTTLFKTEPGYPIRFFLQPAWSPDGSLIAFSARARGNSEVFVMKADGSDVQNATNDPLLDSSAAFSPDGREIIFARDAYGQAKLYRMDADGSNQRRVTDRPGYEMSPAFSPDGAHLAFAGDRESRGLGVFLLDLRSPADETLLVARRAQDGSPAFSPDGGRIAFIATGDGNPEIYVMSSDGTGLFRLTHTKEEEAAPHFSRDGRRILFSSNRAAKFALYQIEFGR
jgi:TolB protein